MKRRGIKLVRVTSSKTSNNCYYSVNYSDGKTVEYSDTGVMFRKVPKRVIDFVKSATNKTNYNSEYVTYYTK